MTRFIGTTCKATFQILYQNHDNEAQTIVVESFPREDLEDMSELENAICGLALRYHDYTDMELGIHHKLDGSVVVSVDCFRAPELPYDTLMKVKREMRTILETPMSSELRGKLVRLDAMIQ
jgi:hypothetical protein